MIRHRIIPLVVVSLLALSAFGATRTWDGTAGTLWSDPGNWEGGVAPSAGDALVFPRTAANLTNTNDYPVDTVFHSLTLGQDNQSTAATINISGNRLRLTNGILFGYYTFFHISLPQIDPVGSQTWGADGYLTVAGNPTLTVATNIPAGTTVTLSDGIADVTVDGAGTLAHSIRGQATVHFAPDFTGTVTTSTFFSGVIINSENAIGATVRANGGACAASCNSGILLANSVVGTLGSTGGFVQFSDPTQLSTAANLELTAGALFFARMTAASPPPLTVLDSVSLGGAALHFVPVGLIPSGHTKVLIDNQSANPVSGMFAGLPEGARVSPGGSNLQFVVSYVGGDGNDVTLTPISTTSNDFDGDGLSDIFWRHSTSGQNYLWTMNGFEPQTMGFVNDVTDLDWKIEGLADFNGDGKCDVLWRHALTGELYTYLMDGRTIVQAGSPALVTDLNWQIVGQRDFDADGKADILWRHALTGDNYLYLMNGINIRSAGNILSVEDTDWKVEALGDFNGDNRADIVWRHAVTGEVYFWFMSGFDRIAYDSKFTMPDEDWKIVAISDFTGEGYSDILWHNDATGESSLYRMHGPYFAQARQLDTVAVEWKIAGTGDYNGDGKSDILWRHATTGENYLYIMGDFSATTMFAAQGAIPEVPDTGWAIER
ncbi:MAG TPA: VCBS repeat-containing protein [Thermoanaerobaculia bacterium]|nr:VCBS repeat-containing protein [Thermoanaerobaculia bacterium]